MEDANRNAVRRFYEEVMNKGSLDLLDDILAEDFEDHGETLFGSSSGRNTLKNGIMATRMIFPNLTVHTDDMIADGDMVGVRGTMTCTHLGPFLGVEPTGNELSWHGLSMFRVVDGQIVSRWFNSDSLSIVQQLGIVPPQ